MSVLVFGVKFRVVLTLTDVVACFQINNSCPILRCRQRESSNINMNNFLVTRTSLKEKQINFKATFRHIL